MQTETSTAIESTTCSRCCGTGRYSFNLMHGSVCYGCSGTGRKLTKRGAAASRFLDALRSVPVETLQVGDTVREMVGIAGGWAFYRVDAITVAPASTMGYPGSTATGVKLELSHPKAGKSGLTTIAGQPARKGFSADEKRAQLIAALAFQDTLTKTGQPRKTKPATTGSTA